MTLVETLIILLVVHADEALHVVCKTMMNVCCIPKMGHCCA